MQLSDLLTKTSIDIISQNNLKHPDALPVEGISCDSRLIKPGCLFAALPGSEQDGHNYIDDAIQAGAAAILCRPDTKLPETVIHLTAENLRHAYTDLCAAFWPRRASMQVAVTGTNGKTSTVEYLRQIWQRLHWPAASLGTLGARTAAENAPGEIAGFNIGGLTTPSAEMLFSTVDNLAKSGISHIALEASSHGISQDRLTGLPVHVAIFTNLSQDHLDFHNDMDSYFAAKAKLFHNHLMLAGYAVINIDDSWGARLAANLDNESVVVVRVGRSSKADVRIIDIKTVGPPSCNLKCPSSVTTSPM